MGELVPPVLVPACKDLVEVLDIFVQFLGFHGLRVRRKSLSGHHTPVRQWKKTARYYTNSLFLGNGKRKSDRQSKDFST
jgi:hypothetical protein